MILADSGFTMEMLLPLLLFLGACLLLSFFLSGMETGIVELSRLRVRRMTREGNVRARRLQRFLDDPEDCLWTILAGNTLANFLAVLLALLGLRDMAMLDERSVGFWVLFGIGGLVFYAICELLPKMLFRQFPVHLCLWLSRPFAIVHCLSAPLVTVLQWVSRALLAVTGGRAAPRRMFGSREELRQVMRETSEGLTVDERVMIDKVLDLQNIPVRDVARPIATADSVDTEMTVIEVLRNIGDSARVRVPVWEKSGGGRRIAGVTNLRQLSYLPESELKRPVGHFLESALFLDEDVRLEAVLRVMRRSGQRAVIILDKRKREMGVVSLPDVLGEVFGEAGN